MMRRTSSSMVAVALSILLVGVAATPTTATAGTGPVAAPARSTGPAPGEVMCSFSGRFTFSPAIGKGGGFTVPSDLKGTLGSCQTTDGSVGIASGILSGTFSGAPFACALGCAGSDASAALSVKWKGTHGGTRARFSDSTITDTGSRAITSAAGDVGFFVPGVGNSSTVTGSFASNGSYLDLVSADTPGQYASAEIAKGGL